MKKNKITLGFTLIELLITIAIVSILSVYGYSSYRTTVMKGYRADGKAKLVEVMQKEQRYYSEKNTYSINLTDLGYSANTVPSDKTYYNISATINTGILTLTATPQGTQATDICKNLLITSVGQKTSSAALTNCW